MVKIRYFTGFMIYKKRIIETELMCVMMKDNGELAQLARASALQAEGQRFESVILHGDVG